MVPKGRNLSWVPMGTQENPRVWVGLGLQQGLEIHGFWFQEKTVQLKTVLHEVYTYVLNEIFFSKNSVSSRLLFKIRVS